MGKYLTEKIVNLVDAGAIFASDITTPAIELDNYQSAKIKITTGAGTTASTTVKVVAIKPDATEVEIKSTTIEIGNKNENIIDVVANELAHQDATSFKLKIKKVDSSTITGSIVAVLGEPRYSE